MFQPFEVGRQLQDGAHQYVVCIFFLADITSEQGIDEFFHLFGQQRAAVDLHHLQGAINLVQISGAETHLGGITRVFDEGFQGLARLVQAFLNFVLDPFQGGVIEFLAHVFVRALSNVIGVGMPAYWHRENVSCAGASS